MAMFSINDSSLGNFNEATREIKETKKKLDKKYGKGWEKGQLPAAKWDSNDNTKNTLRIQARQAQKGKFISKEYNEPTEKDAAISRVMANKYYKHGLKRGISKEELNKEINSAKEGSKKYAEKMKLRDEDLTKREALHKKINKKSGIGEAAKLREAAKYILSVLDEENLDKYLNEGNKAFKHIADIESKTNPYENRSSKQIQSDIKKVMPRQMKEVIGDNYSDETLKKINSVIKNGRNAVSDIYKNKGAAGQYLAKKASNKLAGYTGAELKRRGLDPKTGEKLK